MFHVWILDLGWSCDGSGLKAYPGLAQQARPSEIVGQTKRRLAVCPHRPTRRGRGRRIACCLRCDDANAKSIAFKRALSRLCLSPQEYHRLSFPHRVTVIHSCQCKFVLNDTIGLILSRCYPLSSSSEARLERSLCNTRMMKPTTDTLHTVLLSVSPQFFFL